MCHPSGVQASGGNLSPGVGRLAPQAIACHASSVPNRVCRRVEMAVEKKASLAAKKRMCLVAISAGEHPMKIAIVDESQFRRSQTS